jgi:PKHD-type hydroxylase
MQVIIRDLIEPADVARLVLDLETLTFTDGRATAGWAASLVKRNEQAEADPLVDQWRDHIAAAARASPVFQRAAHPKRIIGPLLSRYREGDSYGTHVDEPLLDGARSDLSFTLFLSDPSSYVGGELVLDTSAGEDAVKLPAGSALLYPATLLHRVAPVTRGIRYAAVGWVRSYIRSAEKREILFDLETARQRLFGTQGKTGDFDLLSKVAANLTRMWCDD